MRDDDVVVGVALGGEARAYPWWVIDNHHCVNDSVGGQALALFFCEVCSSAVAFDPVVGGRRLTFRVGFIYNGTDAYADDDTGSVWSPYLALAIEGPLRGQRLELLPASQLEWAAWRELHPDTSVVLAEEEARAGHGSEAWIGEPQVPEGLRRSVAHWDTRLAHNALVLGVRGHSAQKVYPLDLMRARRGVLEDTLGGEPIVVLHHPVEGSYAAFAFSRRLDGRVLSFRAGPEGAVDDETGSRWSFEGVAVDGPLAGRRLAFVPSHVSEFYVWGAHFPGIPIAGDDDG